MHTIVQNDENDYDIDVAIVFEKSNLNGLGAMATRNMVADALKRKTKQFNAEPEIKRVVFVLSMKRDIILILLYIGDIKKMRTIQIINMNMRVQNGQNEELGHLKIGLVMK